MLERRCWFSIDLFAVHLEKNILMETDLRWMAQKSHDVGRICFSSQRRLSTRDAEWVFLSCEQRDCRSHQRKECRVSKKRNTNSRKLSRMATARDLLRLRHSLQFGQQKPFLRKRAKKSSSAHSIRSSTFECTWVVLALENCANIISAREKKKQFQHSRRSDEFPGFRNSYTVAHCWHF